MTDIPADTLEELKCSSCSAYLSRGPVYLQHDEAAVCGRCYTPKHSATRNRQYEATAKLLKFPCKNWELGCPETVPFVDEAEVVAQEEVCEHRQYVCPVLGSAHCDWLGTRAAMLEHCRDQHLDSVLENPCSLTHDISKSSMHNYILIAYQLLFLLHTKVCVATGKIFHSVRFLGTSEEAENFVFHLDVQRNDEAIMKKSQVAPQGCLAIQEPTSLALDTNSLLNVLGGFDGTTFTVTVKRRVSDAVDQPAKRVKLTRDVVTCAECEAEVTVFRYRKKDGWRCERCAPARRGCENEYCTDTDINNKCKKHKQWFCDRTTRCGICGADVSGSRLSTHYDSKHRDITNRSGSTWWVREIGWHSRLVSSVAGTAVCKYYLHSTQFDLYVHIPVTSERLREFRCEVRLTHLKTGHTQTYTPDALYDDESDWCIKVKKQEFPTWSNEFDVSVNINKID